MDFDKNSILSHIPAQTTTIISGGAKGIDSLAQQIAIERNMPFLEIKPDYGRYGKAAPLARNAAIVSMADQVLAVWDFYSKGTAHVIALCIEKGVPVKIIGPNHQFVSHQQAKAYLQGLTPK